MLPWWLSGKESVRYFSQNWNKKKGLTIHMETQKAVNSQSNVEKEEWNWRIQPF